MYEFSINYLRKLISDSGLKMGIAKQAAMVAIIERLDENRLDGLIKSIQADYDSMVAEIGQKNIAIERRNKELDRLTGSIQRAEEEMRQKLETIKELNLEVEQLREDKDKKRLDMLCEGMLPEERSRVLAFNAAMKLVEERYGCSPDENQVIRSASSIAANWRHEQEKACGKEINP